MPGLADGADILGGMATPAQWVAGARPRTLPAAAAHSRARLAGILLRLQCSPGAEVAPLESRAASSSSRRHPRSTAHRGHVFLPDFSI